MQNAVLERPSTEVAETVPVTATDPSPPPSWCTSTCSTNGCSNQCSLNAGHGGSHRCFTH